MIFPVIVTPPAATPVSLAEAKANMNETSADDDALITSLIEAATGHLDGWHGVLGRALVTQTWRVDLDRFPADGVIRLPLSPVQSITSITYYDTVDATQTLATGVYAGPFMASIGPYLSLRRGQSWPATFNRDDAVSVTFVAGYGTAADVPEPIKQAIKLRVQKLYIMAKKDPSLRREIADGIGSQEWWQGSDAFAGLDMAAEALLAPYKVASL